MVAPGRERGLAHRIPLLGCLVAFAVTGASGAEPAARSLLEAEAFAYRSQSVGEERADLSGIELRWTRSGSRWSFNVAVPALSVSGPSGMMILGPSFVTDAGNRRNGASETAGGVQGAGDSAPAAMSGAPHFDGSGESGLLLADADTTGYDRRSGLGDARVCVSRLLGQDAPFGRFSVRAGVKLPTADEGLGTGEADLWAGAGWRREGWVVNVEAYLEWVKLGDPPDLVLEDGPAAEVVVDWPMGRGGVKGAVEAVDAGIAGESARVRAIAEGYGRMGKLLGWSIEVSKGLTDNAPDFGLAVSLRY